MSHKKTFILAVIFVVYLSLFCSKLQASVLGSKEKKNISQYAYSLLNEYFSNKKTKKEVIKLSKISRKYNYFYLSIFDQGYILCSQGIGSSPIKIRDLGVDIKKTIDKCIKDKRLLAIKKEFKGKEKSIDLDLVFHFLVNEKKIKNKTLASLKDNIQLGVHGFRVENKKESALFRGAFPLLYNIPLKDSFVELCGELGLKRSCVANPETNVYKYETETFKTNKNLRILDLFRYNNLANTQVQAKHLKEAISLAEGWYLDHINPETGLIRSLYYPGDDEYGEGENHFGVMGSSWALLQSQSLTKNTQSPYIARRVVDYYSDFIFNVKDRISLGVKEIKGNDSVFVFLDGKGKLSYNAFLLYNLVKIKNYPNQKNLIKALAQGLLSQQKKDGSFKTYFACDQDTGVDYYPGEAMFGLLEAYEFEKNKKYLESVKKAFAFYRRYWRKNKSAAFVPRHTQVYFKLYGYTQNKKLPAFVFEMNDWLIKNHQITKHKYKDLVGAFGKKRPDSLTSLYAEGINDAYALAVALKDKWRQSFYKEALRKASRFILLTQYKESNSFYLKGYDRAVGGFRRSLIVNELHSDDTQHALRALVKTVKNKIFR